ERSPEAPSVLRMATSWSNIMLLWHAPNSYVREASKHMKCENILKFIRDVIVFGILWACMDMLFDYIDGTDYHVLRPLFLGVVVSLILVIMLRLTGRKKPQL